MFFKNKILVLGTDTQAPYHPLNPIKPSIIKILKKNFSLTFLESLYDLDSYKIETYSIMLLYCDLWGFEIEDRHIDRIDNYLQNNGNLFVVHNGISLQENKKFIQLFGAKFVGHPPYAPVNYTINDPQHPITKGLKSFTLEEELYQFDLFDPTRNKVLITSDNGSDHSPALWISQNANGNIVYLVPGHDTRTFENTTFQKLFLKCALWAVGKL